MASSKKIAQDIQALVGLTPATVKKWKAKMAAFRKAAGEVAAGDTSTAAIQRMGKARDAMDKAIYEAQGDIPYVPGSPQHLAPPIIELNRQRVELVRDLWESSQEKGKEANYKARQAELKKIDAEIRERDRDIAWMRR